jgi:hypothetical protein
MPFIRNVIPGRQPIEIENREVNQRKKRQGPPKRRNR